MTTREENAVAFALAFMWASTVISYLRKADAALVLAARHGTRR